MILVTSGCSFSECISEHIDTWPRHLARSLVSEHVSLGLGSQGNGLIMRKLLYRLEQLKDRHDDILVGIMWSGPNRNDFYCDQHVWLSKQEKESQGAQMNPTGVVPGWNRWMIMNHNWQDRYSKTYYENLYSQAWSNVQTLEYMLHTQWYLERNRIRYFMTTYMHLEIFEDTNPDVKWLADQVDRSKFLPVTGCYEWCRDNTDIKFDPDDKHPSTEQHRLFTEQVIMPYLTANSLV